jgi:hypothetical protein
MTNPGSDVMQQYKYPSLQKNTRYEKDNSITIDNFPFSSTKCVSIREFA